MAFSGSVGHCAEAQLQAAEPREGLEAEGCLAGEVEEAATPTQLGGGEMARRGACWECRQAYAPNREVW